MNCIFRLTNVLRGRGPSLNISRYLTNHNFTNVPPPPLVVAQSLVENPWIWQKNDQIKSPVIYKNKIEIPKDIRWVPTLIEPTNARIIEAPSMENNNIPKEAARLIVIRRKKMKKHKLKKLRKRMKFVWAKIRQKRELKKEKAFQEILIQQCKSAEAFSADKYVQERIDKLNEVITATTEKRTWQHFLQEKK